MASGKDCHEINKVLSVFHLTRSPGSQESGSRKGDSSGDILRQEKIIILEHVFFVFVFVLKAYEEVRAFLM